MNKDYTYELIEAAEDPGNAKIRKHGITVDFTLNDIDRDIKLVEREKEKLEAELSIEDARMQNIDRTNPEIGRMDEHMRKVIYIYQTAFSVCKVGREKIAEYDEMIARFKHEMMDIALQTGVLTNTNGE